MRFDRHDEITVAIFFTGDNVEHSAIDRSCLPGIGIENPQLILFFEWIVYFHPTENHKPFLLGITPDNFAFCFVVVNRSPSDINQVIRVRFDKVIKAFGNRNNSRGSVANLRSDIFRERVKPRQHQCDTGSGHCERECFTSRDSFADAFFSLNWLNKFGIFLVTKKITCRDQNLVPQFIGEGRGISRSHINRCGNGFEALWLIQVVGVACQTVKLLLFDIRNSRGCPLNHQVQQTFFIGFRRWVHIIHDGTSPFKIDSETLSSCSGKSDFRSLSMPRRMLVLTVPRESPVASAIFEWESPS